MSDPLAKPVTQVDAQHVVVFEKSPEEKRFLRKLDICLLAFTCTSQIIKYLDQQNINFAYTSGMQKDLQMYGNELNYTLTYFNVGYCIFLIPSQIMMTWFRPALWLSSLEFLWGVLTMSLAACQNSSSIYAIRVFIGVAESSAYPGAITILMSWYTPTELAKRIGFYHSSQAVGAMLAGALQAAVYKSLNGAAGLAGWRWTFIINGIMTIVVALMGIFLIPDYPDRPNRLAPYLKSTDLATAEDRLERWRRKSPKAINWPTLKKLVLNPMTYFATWIYGGMLMASYGVNYFNLFLQSLKNPDGTAVWTPEALSAVPIGGYAIQIAAVWTFAWFSDYFRSRWIPLLIMCITGAQSTLILLIWYVPTGATYYAYFSMFFSNAAGPLVWSWISDMLPQDPGQRTLMVAACITIYYAVNAWANVLIYPASEAPHYHIGWAVALALWISSGLVICGLRLYDVKIVRPRNERIIEEAYRNREDEAPPKVPDEDKIESQIQGKDTVAVAVSEARLD